MPLLTFHTLDTLACIQKTTLIKYSNILLVLVLLMALSCRTEQNRFEGTWLVLKDGESNRIFVLEPDSLILLDYTALLCDTFITREAGFHIRDKSLAADKLTFSANIDNKSPKFELELSSNLKGKFCVEDECFDVERTDKR